MCDHPLADTSTSLQYSHLAAQPLDASLDLDDIPRVDEAAIPNPFDPHEQWDAASVLRFGEHENGSHLRQSLGQDANRQRLPAVGTRLGQVPIVHGDVLDPHDSSIGFELDDAIDQQERVAMRQDALDRRVI